MRILALLTGFIFLLVQSKAEKYFDFNNNCQQAYNEIISLRIENGLRLLKDEKQIHPDNLIPYFLDNYADLFSLFFNENAEEFEEKESLEKSRLTIMQIGPEDSPWYLFTQSVLNLQWAVIHIKFGERWAAGWNFKAAFKLAKENQKKFPQFIPNQMIMGPLQVAAGTIPKGYQWLSNLLGIKGNISTGMKALKSFIDANDASYNIFKNEAIFYYCYLKFHIENKPEEALNFIKQQKLDVINNHLFAYMATNLSINNQQSSNAKNYILQRNQSSAYMRTPIWDFEMAYAKLYHLETDANIYFNRFLVSFKGNFYLKDCLLKYAWYYFLQGNISQYKQCLEGVKSKGNTDTDADKRALKEAKSGKTPNIHLLKARLLIDGGYASEAFEVLKGKSTADFSSEEEKLEFAYRVGRIYEELGKYDDAIQAYLSTIKIGKERTEYYAARAALQIGNIYEKQKNNKPMAVAFYNQCLAMEDHDYKNSLDQKAKAGIERCNGR